MRLLTGCSGLLKHCCMGACHAHVVRHGLTDTAHWQQALSCLKVWVSAAAVCWQGLQITYRCLQSNQRCCRLELQARNNSKLLVALEELLDRLTLPEDTEQLLVQANFDINRCRV